jgi:DNA-directed RNA polymerase specialized sigma24 family protein
MREYISQNELVWMLDKHSTLVAINKSLQAEMTRVTSRRWRERVDDTIEGKVYSRRNDGMPGPAAGNISDKTASVAASYRGERNHAWDDSIGEVADELSVIGMVIEKVDIALDTLSADQRQIIRDFYFERKTISVIADEIKASEGTVKWQKNQALSNILRVIRIDKRTFDRTCEIYNRGLA